MAHGYSTLHQVGCYSGNPPPPSKETSQGVAALAAEENRDVSFLPMLYKVSGIADDEGPPNDSNEPTVDSSAINKPSATVNFALLPS